VFLTVLIHILIFSVLSVHIYCFIYLCTRIPVSASEPRFSSISVHVICLLTDFHIYMCTLIIKFNSTVTATDAYLLHLRSNKQIIISIIVHNF